MHHHFRNGLLYAGESQWRLTSTKRPKKIGLSSRFWQISQRLCNIRTIHSLVAFQSGMKGKLTDLLQLFEVEIVSIIPTQNQTHTKTN